MEGGVDFGSLLGHSDRSHVQQLWLVHAPRRVAHVHEAHPPLQHWTERAAFGRPLLVALDLQHYLESLQSPNPSKLNKVLFSSSLFSRVLLHSLTLLR